MGEFLTTEIDSGRVTVYAGRLDAPRAVPDDAAAGVQVVLEAGDVVLAISTDTPSAADLMGKSLVDIGRSLMGRGEIRRGRLVGGRTIRSVDLVSGGVAYDDGTVSTIGAAKRELREEWESIWQ
jgi:hypothetical protein